MTIQGVTGGTRLLAVLGDPVQQVQAPRLMNRLFRERGVDAVMVPIAVSAIDLPTVIAGLTRIGNFDGFLVTIPHKPAICPLLSGFSEAVALAGSANAVRRDPEGTWFGENFDGTGFVAGLLRAGFDPAGRVATLVGTGGAGAAIAVALLQRGTGRLLLTDANPDRAAALARRLDARWPGRVEARDEPGLVAADLAVNATPIGLDPSDPLPFDVRLLPDHAVVADIIMKPAETWLLAAARARHLRAHPGIHMLEEQIALYQEFFGMPSECIL